MKKLFLLLAAVGMLFTACEMDGDINGDDGGSTSGGISLSQGKVTFDYEGGECELIVSATHSWDATCPADWVILSTRSGIAGDEPLKFTIKQNYTLSERTATITLKNENYNHLRELYIVQTGITSDSPCAIQYTSSNGEIVSPSTSPECDFGANIISNEYKDGVGFIVFDGPVTKIGHYAFYDCTSLTSVIIPDSVTEIGHYAFEVCASLTNITIPDSVTWIGDAAFAFCSNLMHITIPDSVTEIGHWLFQDCTSLTSITIPDNVKFIGSFAFS